MYAITYSCARQARVLEPRCAPASSWYASVAACLPAHLPSSCSAAEPPNMDAKGLVGGCPWSPTKLSAWLPDLLWWVTRLEVDT